MPDQFHIERAVPQDAAVIEALAREIWSEHYTAIIGEEQVSYMLETFQSAKAIAQQILSGTVYYISFDGKIPCGYSAIKPDQKGLFLSKLYVKDSHREQGVARMMLNAIRNYAKEANIDCIWLTCNKNNTGSLLAYEHLGFSIVGESVTDIGHGFKMDDYVLQIQPKEPENRFKEAVRRLLSPENK